MPITLNNVSKRYGQGRLVLDEVNLEVGDGEAMAVMGPSGSGKTTLLSILGLLLDPTSGSVSIDGAPAPGRERLRHPTRSRAFGWVLQTVNVINRRSAQDNVAIPLLAAGYRRHEANQVAQAVLSRVGLGDRIETPARFLSGGEVQRVCIARALAHRPRYLLCDEPTGQLDHQTSIEVLEALWGLLSSTGSTLVVATHDPTVAEACSRIIDLVNGKICSR